MSLESEIADWDLKSMESIESIARRYEESPTFVTDLVTCLNVVPQQPGASWLLKRFVEQGGELSAAERSGVCRSLGKLEHWSAKLHILQCLPMVPIPIRSRLKVEAFLRANLGETNKFVRAWTFNGFYVLASQFPEYLDETKQLLERALNEEAASVRARIRNILKDGF